MKPQWIHSEQFTAELTDRYERTFIVRREVYRVRIGPDFCLRNRQGYWRPCPTGENILHEPVTEYDSDGSSVPFPLPQLIGAFNTLRYKRASMGLHDPAYRYGKLMHRGYCGDRWHVESVSKTQADQLLHDGILATGGWAITANAYWLGVRITHR
jgi:hypothetical protein